MVEAYSIPGVPERACSRAILGVYELTRVELLRDLYRWAYERSTQEYLAIRQNLAEPDALRLTYRDVIKRTVRDVVGQPDRDPLEAVRLCIADQKEEPNAADIGDLEALILEELRRLHEGTLARYGLRPGEYSLWRQRQWP